MKVMLNPSAGVSVSSRGVKSAVKSSVAADNTTKATHSGYSNEEIYNAIINFKNKITGLFSSGKQSEKLNVVA